MVMQLVVQAVVRSWSILLVAAWHANRSQATLGRSRVQGFKVFPWQANFVHDPGVPENPMPYVKIEHISDVLFRDFAMLLGTKTEFNCKVKP